MRFAFVLAVAVFVSVQALPTHALAANVPVSENAAKFDHESITLQAGDALIVTNADTANHNLKLVDEDGDPQDLGVQKPGRVVRINFPSAGAYRLRCAITPDMRMTVQVN